MSRGRGMMAGLLCLLALMPLAAHAREWTVDDDGPADFPTIQQAINVAASGDTITVRDGTYPEHLTVAKAVSIQAENVGKAVLDGAGQGILISVRADATFSGLWLRNAARGIELRDSGAHFVVERCIAADMSEAAFLVNQRAAMVGRATIHHCVVVGSPQACNINDGDTIWVRNTIIVNVDRAYGFWHGNAIIPENNLLWNVQITGGSGVVPDPEQIIADPLFVDPEAGDFHLQAGSPAIDSGKSWGQPYLGAAPDRGAYEYSNSPPVADAGEGQIVEQTSGAGAEVTLDGSGSSDPDGDELTYSWTWPGGSATGVSPTIALPLGTTTVTLVVNDGQADSAPDAVLITVRDTTPPQFLRRAVSYIPAHESESFFDRLGGGSLGGDYLRVWDVAGIWKNADAFMKFDLSGVPGNAQIVSATLLTRYHSRNGSEIVAVTESPNDAWQSGDPGFPGFGERLTAPRGTWTGLADKDLVTWDLALGDWLARDLADDTSTLVLTHWDGPDGDWVEFYRHTDPQHGPVLRLEYLVPGVGGPADITVEQETADGTVVHYDVAATDVCDAQVDVVCDPPSGSVFPLGETVVTCTATDDSGNVATCQFTILVVDTTPPRIYSETVEPGVLWPPDHRMVHVTVDALVHDICDATPSWKIVSVASNEPINGLGDGDTAPDWEITGEHSLELRAERSGNGSGRVYTITIEATDASGNAATASCVVTVPHDKKK